MSKENNSIFSGRKMTVEYMCVYCGMRVPRSVNASRPAPGKCPKRKYPSGVNMPHRWVVNRRY